MQTPQRFPLLMTLVVIIVALCMLLISVPSYLAFGDHIKAVVFDSLLQSAHASGKISSAIVHAATLGYLCSALFTFPLMILPGTRIVENHISRWEGSGADKLRIKWTKNLIRFMCVGAVSTIAWTVGSRLENLVALVGALCCGPLLL
jgi:proton-coupled amino acid transporter